MSLEALLKCRKLARRTPIYTVLIQHRAQFSSGIAVDVFSRTYLNKIIWAAEKPMSIAQAKPQKYNYHFLKKFWLRKWVTTNNANNQ